VSPAISSAAATLYTALAAVARANPDQPAVDTAAGTRDYRWLLGSVDAVAGALVTAGVLPGQRVGLLCPNQAEFAQGFFAVARLGAAVVPINPALREVEIAAVLRDASVSGLLTMEAWRERAERALTAAGADRAPVRSLEEAARAPGVAPGQAAADGDAPLLVLFSSGSTGRPKRVERSHRQLLWETERLAAALGVGRADRILGAAPFSHVNGLVRSLVLALLSGATLVPVPEFERRAVGRLIQARAVTGFIGVPFMFAALAETRWPAPVDLSSLRYCLSASAPLRAHVRQRFRERYGVDVCQLYGTTETGTVALEPPGDAGDSVGMPLPGVEVGVLDEAGRVLPPGHIGQIAIRSPAAATSYPGRPAESAEAFRDGAFRPGDVGRIDPAGCIHLVGRTSLFINRGGFKVNPIEVEETVEGHPKVREAAAVGQATELGDERIRVVVVAREPCSVEEIIEHCRSRMADFKVPSLVEFRDALPRSAAGKLLRRDL
jgi:long-chain acyl-CoA synthetase